MNFETTIGLEVHVELKTHSKIYSPTPVEFGDEPNANTNVIDWAYPGTLPTLNKGVVRDRGHFPLPSGRRHGDGTRPRLRRHAPFRKRRGVGARLSRFVDGGGVLPSYER